MIVYIIICYTGLICNKDILLLTIATSYCSFHISPPLLKI
nr:MAG TPA: hypothetical protein [Caudoviricetes sp.]